MLQRFQDYRTRDRLKTNLVQEIRHRFREVQSPDKDEHILTAKGKLIEPEDYVISDYFVQGIKAQAEKFLTNKNNLVLDPNLLETFGRKIPEIAVDIVKALDAYSLKRRGVADIFGKNKLDPELIFAKVYKADNVATIDYEGNKEAINSAMQKAFTKHVFAGVQQGQPVQEQLLAGPRDVQQQSPRRDGDENKQQERSPSQDPWENAGRSFAKGGKSSFTERATKGDFGPS